MLEEFGDFPLIQLRLGRTPVEAVLVLFLNLASSWRFENKKVELGYDEIYHNYLLVTLQNSKQFTGIRPLFGVGNETVGTTILKFEKAHRIRLMKPTIPTDYVDVYDIPLTPNKTFTLNRLITTASNVDKQFYSYDAGNNNMCQTFVENIVDINGLTGNIVDNATRTALKPQDARALVATLGSRSDLVKRVTDLGGQLDTWVFDRKIIWKKPVPKEFSLFGNMHVKTVDTSSAVGNEAVLQSGAHHVVIDGSTDTLIENTDDVFNAVMALEQGGEKKDEPTPRIYIIFFVLLAVAGIAAAIKLGSIFWQRRKGIRRSTPSVHLFACCREIDDSRHG